MNAELKAALGEIMGKLDGIVKVAASQNSKIDDLSGRIEAVQGHVETMDGRIEAVQSEMGLIRGDMASKTEMSLVRGHLDISKDRNG